MLDRTASSTLEVSPARGPHRATREKVPWWASPYVRDIALNVGVAAGYWLLAELTLLPSTASGRVTPMWPSSGLAVAAVLLRGPRLLPGIFLGAFFTMALRVPVPAALLVGLGAVLGAVIDVKLLQRFKFDTRLERVRDPMILTVAAMIGAMVPATLGTLATYFSGAFPADQAPYGWTLWWMRDWLGVQLVVALVLSWARSRAMVWTRPRIIEGIALSLAMLIASQILFGLWAIFPGQNVPLAFLLFPLVGYAGLRFGPPGAATLVALVAVFALPVAALGLGPFANFPIVFTHFLLHIFLLLGSLSGQTLAAVMAEREDAVVRRLALEEQLRHSQKMEAPPCGASKNESS